MELFAIDGGLMEFSLISDNLKKASSPIDSTDSGIVILDNFLHSPNAPSSIEVSPSFNTTFSIL